MTDNFDVASAAARRCARKLIKTIPPVIAADAMITAALAAWAADTGRQADATDLLRIWTAIRDAN